MKRIASLAILTLLALAPGLALAQVATTDLVPSAPIVLSPGAGFVGPADANLVPDNPAALAWGDPSRLGLGRIMDTEHQPVGQPVDKFDGYYVGFRWLNEPLGVAGEQVNLSGSGLSYDESNTHAAVSYQATDAIALGAGLRAKSVDYGGSSSDDMNTFNLGLSVRLGETIFLGYGMGRDDLERKIANVVQINDDRDYTMYGAALRTKGSVLWYLAYDVIDASDFNQVSGATAWGSGFSNNTLTLQVNFGGVLLGYQSVEVEYKDGGRKVDGRVMDLGWAPKKGLSVSGRVVDTGEKDNAGAKIADDKMTAISVAVLF